MTLFCCLVKRTWVLLTQALLAGIGLLWVFLEPYYTFSPQTAKIGFSCFIITGLVAGLIWYFINGFFLDGFLKSRVKIRSNAVDTDIEILFGDIFKQGGFKAIAVNEYYDSIVDDKLISRNTLHGMMLTKYWAAEIADWDKQITKDLEKVSPLETLASKQKIGKLKRYEIGTVARVSKRENDFLCVVLSKTDLSTLEASSDVIALYSALKGLLEKARTVCAGNPLNIPLMGSGLSRTGIKANMIVNMIILAIIDESKKQKITQTIRIVLPVKSFGEIDITTISKEWR